MALKVYNTLTRSQQEFVPLDGSNVRMYTCGPTVYNFAHIGNFRAYMFEDLLRRHLKYRDFNVTQVMNLTDVDDKTIRGSIAEGKALCDFTKIYKDAFFEDLEILGIEPAEHYPAATDHVPEMIDMIKVLEEKGHAYRSEDGSVYFSIASFPEYGKLAHLDKSGLQAGARVDQDEYDKENLADFALWKGYVEADGDVVWDSPWGKGRPGWHIECSAMSRKYLGDSFDIHTGGVDNIFPHHEDEIAQSEGVSGKPLAGYWMHCAHLIVEGKKMSKSAGNFFTLRDLLDKGYSGREIRYVLLACQYRKQLNFCFADLDDARIALRRVDTFKERLTQAAGDASTGLLPSWAVTGNDAFGAALDDDLNVSGALGALYAVIHDGNKALDNGSLTAEEATAILALLERWDSVLNVLEGEEAEEAGDDVQQLVEQRTAARAAKDWAEADRIRDALAAQGWTVKDSAEGPQLVRL